MAELTKDPSSPTTKVPEGVSKVPIGLPHNNAPAILNTVGVRIAVNPLDIGVNVPPFSATSF